MSNSRKKSKKEYNREVYPLRVLGKTYWVTIIDQPEIQLDGRRNSGITDNRSQNINLAKNQGFDQLRETLIHELLHVWEDSYSIKIEHKDIYNLAVFLYALMRDNPSMIKWIMEANETGR